MLERIQAQAGVSSAAITNAVPLGGAPTPGATRFQIEGQVIDDPERRPTVDVRVATPQYFATIGVPVVGGRVFTDLDAEESVPVVVINKAMTKYWNGVDPIGSRITLPAAPLPGTTTPRLAWYTIVGIVGDVRQFGLAQETVAQAYLPLAQSPFGVAGIQSTVKRRHSPKCCAARAASIPISRRNIQTLDDLRSGARRAAPHGDAARRVRSTGVAGDPCRYRWRNLKRRTRATVCAWHGRKTTC